MQQQQQIDLATAFARAIGPHEPILSACNILANERALFEAHIRDKRRRDDQEIDARVTERTSTLVLAYDELRSALEAQVALREAATERVREGLEMERVALKAELDRERAATVVERERAGLVAERAILAAVRASLAAERAILAAERAELAAERTELDDDLEELSAAEYRLTADLKKLHEDREQLNSIWAATPWERRSGCSASVPT